MECFRPVKKLMNNHLCRYNDHFCTGGCFYFRVIYNELKVDLRVSVHIRKLKKWRGFMGGIKKFGIITVMVLLLCSGCGKKALPVEDYVSSNPAKVIYNAVMKTDTGYYYGSSEKKMSIHYYDVGSGQNIFLCSKPECRHNGDAFCTATSDKYFVDTMCMYGGELYLNVVEKTDTEYQYKLLKVAADGTKLTELVTYMTVNNTSVAPVTGSRLVIHRGYAVMSYIICNKDNMDIGERGLILYNMADGKITYINKSEFSDYSFTRYDVDAHDDYIYYNFSEGHKNRLHRFSLKDKSDETLEFLINYNETYTIWDDDTIYYLRKGNSLNKYKISTKENTEYKNFFRKKFSYISESWGECEADESFEPDSLVTDGKYLYVTDGAYFSTYTCEIDCIMADDTEQQMLERNKSRIFVYDKDLQQVAVVVIETDKYLGYKDYFSLAILDGMVYLQTPKKMFACTVEEFVEGGTPPFKEIYNNEVDIPSLKDSVQ